MPYTKVELLPNQLSILKSFNPDPSDQVRYNISDACPNTLSWFLDDRDFTAWRDSSQPTAFWIHGSPGQGKSVLAKFLVKHLEDHAKAMPSEKVAIISYFCQGQKEDKPTDILRALILQLIDCQEFFEPFNLRFQGYPLVFEAASFSQLWDFFAELALLSQNQRVYCIIDAIDECLPVDSERTNLLQRLTDLFSRDRQRKVLITSRPDESDIKSSLVNFHSMSLHARSEDLNLYVRSELDKLPNKESLSDPVINKIRDTLEKQAGSTFLWASLIIKQVGELDAPSLYQVEELLKGIPEGLDKLYSKLADRLIIKPLFAKILTWVAYAKR